MKSIKIFISYAHEDSEAVVELRKHLTVLEGDHVATQWTDHAIKPGEDWDHVIKKNLESADIIVFLCSKHLFCSRYVQEVEIKTAIERVKNEGIMIIPIILEPVAWESSLLKSYLALPKDAVPISRCEDKNLAYSEIVRELSDLVNRSDSGKIQNNSFLRRFYNNFFERTYYRSQNSFSDIVIDDKLRYFISPLAVLSEQKKSNVISSKPLSTFIALQFFLKELLGNSNKQHFLLLGDSGLGKSTLMIKLFLKLHQRQFFRRNKFNVLFLSFNDEYGRGIDRKLDLIAPAEQRNTILLLDGFDEDFEALKDYESRFNKLCERLSGFHKVVISCKTQLFPSESGIKETGKIISTRTKSFTRIYLTDFTAEAVRKYLNKRFRSNKKSEAIKKTIAIRIVNNCSKLVTRPLILFFIDDLIDDILNEYQENNLDCSAETAVENEIKNEEITGVESSKIKSYHFSYQVYEAIIEKWLNWEAVKIIRAGKQNRISDERKSVDVFQNALRDFSLQLAIDQYQLQMDGKKKDFLFTRTEIVETAKAFNLGILDEQAIKTSLFQSHSLLNRNALGYYKFSHKTIREYLLATSLFKDKIDESLFRFDDLEYAKKFYNEMCWDKTTHYSPHFIEKLNGEGIYDASSNKELEIFLEEKLNYNDALVSDLIEKFPGHIVRTFLLDQASELRELIDQMIKLDDLFNKNSELKDIRLQLNTALHLNEPDKQAETLAYLMENPKENQILNQLYSKYEEYLSYFQHLETLLLSLEILNNIFRIKLEDKNPEYNIAKLSYGYDLKCFIIGYTIIRKFLHKGYQSEEIGRYFDELSVLAFEISTSFEEHQGSFSSASLETSRFLDLNLIKAVDSQNFRFICPEIFGFFLAVYLLQHEDVESDFNFNAFPIAKEYFIELIWFHRIQKFDNRFYPNVFISSNPQLAAIKITGVFQVVFKSHAVLNYYKNFQGIDIPSNEIEDITPILALTHLQKLNLRNNRISDVTGIEKLGLLKHLDLSNNQITGLESIAKIPNLNTLILNQNPVDDISPLCNALNLHTLILSENNIQDITPLSQLKKLVHLDLFRNQISSLEPIRELRQLESLALYDSPVDDISPLQELTQLKSLSLRNLGLRETGHLSKMSFLEKLDLGRNKIIDISPIAKLTRLTNLNIDENQISNIDIVQSLNKLTYFNAYFNNITDIQALEGLTELEELEIHDNQIKDISILKNSKNLKKLQLQRNLIEDISQLSNLTQLVELGVHGNLINDFSIVNKLPNLKTFTFDIINQKQYRELLQNAGRIKDIPELWISLRRLEDMDFEYLNELENLNTVEVINKKNFPFDTLKQLKIAHTLHLRDNELEEISFLKGNEPVAVP
ncbi:MAG: leucine-rich repeat domain-containing protein [Bacteroidales bacterium]|nr:leucine-rich repeat domain-containing protein [Bacteroidales bacterium]